MSLRAASRATRRRVCAAVLVSGAAVSCASHALAGPNDVIVTAVIQTDRFDDGRMHFRVLGTFPAGANLRSEVSCNGRPIASTLESESVTAAEVYVNLAVQPSHTRCSFGFAWLDDASRSIPSSASELELFPPLDEIGGSRDRGRNGGRHFVELYGRFPSFPILDAKYGVDCSGSLGPASNVTIDYRTSSQINVSFDERPDARCTFVLGYTGPSAGRRTNLWGPLDLRPHDALTGFGAYHWSTEVALGPDSDDTLGPGQRPLTRAGFDVVRVGMSPEMRQRTADQPRYKENLDLFTTECPIGAPFLPCAARSRGYQRLFSDPGARIVMLTAADSSSWGDDGSKRDVQSLNPDWWTPANTALVVREYRNLALALYETQRDTGKTFIVANWETDNFLTCGVGIGAFALNATIQVGGRPVGARSVCEGGPNPPFRTNGALIRWFLARKQGIAEAASLARTRSLGGVVVADGIEIASIRWLHNVTSSNPWGLPPCRNPRGRRLPHCLNTVDDIIPLVNPAFVSYSAWESIRDDLPGSPPSPTSVVGRTPSLDFDLAALKRLFPGSAGKPQLIVGEFGVEFNPDLSNAQDAFAFGEVARAVQRAELPVNVAWAGYDSLENGTLRPYGLFDRNGGEKYGMTVLRDALAAGREELSLPARISGVVVTTTRGPAGDWYDLFEVYGSFPSAPTQFSLTCSPPAVQPELVASTTTQVNLRMKHQNYAEQYCSVKFPGSRTHGPKKVWSGPCDPAAPSPCR